MPDGKRIRQNFGEKTDALMALGDLQLEIEETPEPRKALRTLLTPEELSDAESAKQLIGNHQTLSQVVAHYENLRKQAEEAGTNLDEAMSFFRSHYRAETTEITVFNAKWKFLQSRQDISDKTRANYESGLKLLMKQDPNKPVHTFTVTDLEGILGSYSEIHTRRSYRIIFNAFFKWAVRHHYCLENPCERLEKLPKDLSMIALLSLEESKRLLQAAIAHQDGIAAASIAIGMFAGLRPSEIGGLTSESIMTDKIRVTGGKMRRKVKRSVPIPPVLKEWLKEFSFTGLPNGWDYKMKILKRATRARQWVKDIIRHTSISYQTERDRNEGLTVMNCGTSIQMLNLHYREVIDDETAVTEFWNLTPSKIREEATTVELPSRKKVDWPSKAKLKKLVWKKALIHVANDLGVSDVAARKRCVKLGIELPPRGHWLK